MSSLLLTMNPVSADEASKNHITNISVTINGIKQSFPQSAAIINGYTLVPMRSIFEKLGASISWNQATNTVTAVKRTTVIELTVGSKKAYVDGYPINLPIKAQVVNGTIMVPLKFVSQILGGTCQWDQESMTVKIVNASATANPASNSPSFGGGKSPRGLTVRYGIHDYASKNQAEYNKVMEIVDKGVARLPSIELDTDERTGEYFKRYFSGDRAKGYPTDSLDYRYLTIANNYYGHIVEAGVSKETIDIVRKARQIAIELREGAIDPLDASPRSAYDALVNKRTDCDSDAQVYSAVFDSLGFNNTIVANPGHADIYIELEGKWFNIYLMPVDMHELLTTPGYYIMSKTTDGSIIS